MDHLGQAFGQCSLAHPGFPHEYGVVLAAPAEHLHGSFKFQFPSDQGVQLPLRRLFNQVGGKNLQRIFLFLFFTLFRLAVGLLLGNFEGKFGNIMRLYIKAVKTA
jgi:hypothetical protein